jgi:hypothetical protein
MSTRINRGKLAMMAGASALVMAGGGTALATSASAAPAAPASPAVISGVEHFQAISANPNSPLMSFIAYGAFTAAGTDNESGVNALEKLPKGTFQIEHTQKGSGTTTFDVKACSGTFHATGTFKLVKGTGAYDDLSGSGTYSLSVIEIGAKVNGKCSQNALPVAGQVVLDATGNVRL